MNLNEDIKVAQTCANEQGDKKNSKDVLSNDITQRLLLCVTM